MPEFGYVVLFYDEGKAAVGVMLTNDGNEPGALKISGDRNNTYLSARPFLDRYGISYGNSTRYVLKKVKDLANWMVFHLNEPLPQQTKERAPSAKDKQNANTE